MIADQVMQRLQGIGVLNYLEPARAQGIPGHYRDLLATERGASEDTNDRVLEALAWFAPAREDRDPVARIRLASAGFISMCIFRVFE